MHLRKLNETGEMRQENLPPVLTVFKTPAAEVYQAAKAVTIPTCPPQVCAA